MKHDTKHFHHITEAPADNEVVRHLKQARARIARPDRWCQGMIAQTKDGEWCLPEYGAYRECAVGALGLGDNASAAGRYLERSARSMGYMRASDLNDFTDLPTVLRMYDRAIEMAGANKRT